MFLGGLPWADSLCHTPPLQWQSFLQNVPRRHERDDKKACASSMCTIAVGLLRWCSLIRYHHRQHFQQYQAWMTLFVPSSLSLTTSMYESTDIPVSECPFYILSIGTLGDFLRWRMVFMSVVLSCYGAEPWHQWSTHGAWAGTEFRFWGRLVCPDMRLCCFYIMIIFVYSMVGWVICHLILFRVLIKGIRLHCLGSTCW